MGLSIKSFLPRTLLGRSLMILITPILLIQAIATFIFFDRHWSKMTMRLAYAVSGEIAWIANTIEDDPSEKHLTDVIRYAAESLNLVVSVRNNDTLLDKKSNLEGDAWKSHMAQTLKRELENNLRRPFTLTLDKNEKWVEVSVQLDKGILTVIMPERRLFSSSGYIFLLWMIGSSVVLLAIAILFMRNQIRPIHKLAAAAERFGKGRDVAYFKPAGAKEVRQAGEAFLEMHKRIRRQVEQRTTMLAGVSHDLRTPLTRLKLQIAMMDDNPDTIAMKGDIQEMEKMIGGYLDFVRGEGDEGTEEISLRILIEKIIEAARRQNMTIEFALAQDILIMMRPMAMERAIMNIVNNAGKYANQIWISTRIDGKKYAFIEVEDDGPGIPENLYEDVFRPFYRVDQSRTAATGSVGLGLPIAMDIIHSHGGKIWLEKSKYGGLKVIIRLPL